MAEYEDFESPADGATNPRFTEGQSPPSLNNGAREIEAIIARNRTDNSGVTDAGGTANALTLSSAKTLSVSYDDGLSFVFTATATNTDQMTFNADSIGIKDVLLCDGSPTPPGSVVTNGIYKVVYKTTEDCFYLTNPSTGILPRGFIAGLKLSNNGVDALHDIDVAVGVARDRTNTLGIPLNSILTKRIDAAWAVGSGNGGYASASALAPDESYGFHLIYNGSTTAPVVDAGIDISAVATQLKAASGYTHSRRIGSVLTDGSSNVVAFTQEGDDFTLDVPVNDINETDPGSGPGLKELSVPTGLGAFKIKAKTAWRLSDSDTAAGNNTAMIITTPGITGASASSNVFAAFIRKSSHTDPMGANVYGEWLTSTNGQVIVDLSRSDANITLVATTFGWIDRRGQDD